VNVTPLLAGAVSSIAWKTFWPYVSGCALLVVGVATLVRAGAGRLRGLDRVVALGPIFLAAPIGVFGTEHFVFTDAMTALVPRWLPARVFWTYLTGTALVAGALGIVARRVSGLAAALLGLMMGSFVLLIHLPNFARFPGNRFAMAVFLRETSFCGGCIALAVAEGFGPLRARSGGVLRLARVLVGVPALVFGIEHLLHPTFAPVVPLDEPMPTWIPARAAIGVLTGVILIAAGANLIVGKWAKAWATGLGTWAVALVVLVYGPWLVATPGIEKGLNFFADTLLFGGAVLSLAGALPPGEAAARPRAASCPTNSTGLDRTGPD
jgi:uncharacterized membrane protein